MPKCEVKAVDKVPCVERGTLSTAWHPAKCRVILIIGIFHPPLT